MYSSFGDDNIVDIFWNDKCVVNVQLEGYVHFIKPSAKLMKLIFDNTNIFFIPKK